MEDITRNMEQGPPRKASNLNIKSTICFKVADIARDNQAKISKYGQKIGKKSPNFQISCRLQMVSESRDFWQVGRKRFNLTRSILRISI